jgi:hypothetical protein
MAATGSPLAGTAALGTAELGASGMGASAAWAFLGIRSVAVGAALSPGGSGSAFGAQSTRFGAGTAQASGLLAGQRPGKVVGRAVLAACGGILGWGLVVVGSVAGHGLLLSVSARSDSMI